jgi:hypothetical protein
VRVGTKSLLFGYHAFWLHPFFVAAAWRRLYGFTLDPRHWAGFFLHDIGYWGKPNMDGLEGKEHPFFGAYVMHRLFDRPDSAIWFHFSLYHSREMAHLYFGHYSRLCYADKLAFHLYPKWLLRALYGLSGELKEYMDIHGEHDFDRWHRLMVEPNLKMLKDAQEAPNELCIM